MPRHMPPWLDAVLLDDSCPLPLNDPFTRIQAEREGVSRRQFKAMLDRKLVREVTRGVYVVGQVRDTIEVRAQALRLVVPDSIVVADRTAAWLHGVDALPRSAAHAPVPLDLVSTAHSRTRRPAVTGRIRDLAETDVTRVQGLPVTTPVRTALDLGRGLRRYDAFAALCGFLRVGLDHGQLLGQIERFRGERGVVQLRELAPLADARPESAAEAVLLLHCWDCGLDSAEPQRSILDDSGHERYRLDIAVPELKLAFEYQGELHHASPEQRERDAVRRRWLEARGWCIVEVWAEDLFGFGVDPMGLLQAGVRRARARLSEWQPQGEFL